MSNDAMTRDAVRIREQLRDSETQVDDTLFGMAELMKRMLSARRNPAVVPHTGQEAIIRLANAQHKIITGANELFRVHNHLGRIGVETGVIDEEGTTPTFSPSASEDDFSPRESAAA